MSAEIIDGKAIAARVRAEVKAAADALAAKGVTPGLAVVLVGEDPPSQVYVRSKTKAAREAGIATFDHKLPATTSKASCSALVRELNADPRVDGILVQFPVPQADRRRSACIETIRVDKDVDGLHPTNLGRLWAGDPRFVACTPQRLHAPARRGAGRRSPAPRGGASAARSSSASRWRRSCVNANATVTMCHSQTKNLAEVVRRADIVVAAIGSAELVRGDWIKPGATVIDVGMNRGSDGKLVGDVEFAAAAKRARAITPVPGGVGPMTIAMLLANTVRSAARRAR